MIEHHLQRLVCPCFSTSTCAPLPVDLALSRYGPRICALVGLLGSAFPLSFSKTQALLHQLLDVDQPPYYYGFPQATEVQPFSCRLQKRCMRRSRCRWPTSMKPVLPPVMPTGATPIAGAAGRGLWRHYGE